MSRAASVCLLLALVVVLALSGPTMAQKPGRNVNMVSGTELPDGDPYLQRQGEGWMTVSARNPLHLFAGGNDYRTVDLPGLPGDSMTGDAWVSYYISVDGGEGWFSTLLPGFPQDTSAAGLASPLKGFEFAADPVVAAGAHGLFFYAGLVADRDHSESAIFVSRFIDLNNKENGVPIHYIDARLAAAKAAPEFADKPAMGVDIPRAGAQSVTLQVPVDEDSGETVTQEVSCGNVYIAYANFFGSETTGDLRSQIHFSRSTDCGETWSAPMRIDGAEPAGDPTAEGFAHALALLDQLIGQTNATADAAGLSPDERDSLTTKLAAAKDSLGRARANPAIGQIGAYINEVEAFIRSGRLTAQQGEPLIAAAQTILDIILGLGEDRGERGVPNQGAAIAIDPRNGDVYVAWRQFGTDELPHAMFVARSVDGGLNFDPPVEVAQIAPFDQGTSIVSFRTNSFPSLAVDGDGVVYLAYATRGVGPEGDARVVIQTSSDGGASWSAAAAVENHGDRGHQFMPALSFAAGKLTLLFYDAREDTSGRFDLFIDDTFLPRHTIDVRVAQADPGAAPAFAPSVRVSRYQHFMPDANSLAVELAQLNPPNFPLFAQGTAAFIHDYIHVAAQQIQPDGAGGWQFNVEPDRSVVFHGVFTDNRDVREPLDGDWSNYTPPNSVQPPEFATSVDCLPDRTGMRNQNLYYSQIAQGIAIASPGNSKPLGIQRAFVVYAQNVTDQPRTVRMQIAGQPPGGLASFLQFELIEALDLVIPAFSLAARTVFLTSTDPTASVGIDMFELDGPGGSVVGSLGSVLLNGDPSNPEITDPDVQDPNIVNPNIVNFEVYNPNIVNPNIVNPNIVNPNIVNPNIVNPNIVNPNIVNPNIVNPNIVNPNIVNPNIVNPNIVNPNIVNAAVQDVQWTAENQGNTTAAYTFKMLSDQGIPEGIHAQLLISRVFSNPAALGCSLEEAVSEQLMANIINPAILDPSTADISNPNIVNSAIDNATFFLAPGDEALITLRVFDPDTTDGVFFDPNDVSAVVVAHAVNTEDVANGITEPPVAANLLITTTTLPTATTGVLFDARLQTFGGTGPFTWSVTGGALPPGLTLDSASGQLSGTPTAAGDFQFTVEVVDSSDPVQRDTQVVSMSVVEPPVAFGPASIFATGDSPEAVAAGDLNRDGNLDLVTANFENGSTGSASVLLGNGDGTFGAATTLSMGGGSHDVQLGDIDGDADLDVLVANLNSGDVSIRKNNGNGTFSAPTTVTAASFVQRLAVADVDSDSILDVVVTEHALNRIGVFLGNGDGTFVAEVPFDVGTFPWDVGVGDLNGDGRPDLAVSNRDSQDVSILLGTGTRALFSAATSFSGVTAGSTLSLFDLALGDLDSDGAIDIALGTNDGRIFILRGNGDGTFGAATSAEFVELDRPVSLQMADLSRDGRLDIAAGNFDRNFISVLTGDGTGSVTALTDFDIGMRPSGLTVADLNGDGKLDVAAVSSFVDRVAVLLNESTGGESGPSPLPLDITTTSLPNAVAGTPYGATLQATGGTPSLTWTVTTGALPAGLSLNGTTGQILGTPTAAGVFDFTVEVTDSSSPAQTAAQALSITIEPAVPTVVELKQVASDASAGDQFGVSVSVFGDTALVGAPADDDAGTDSGSVYAFRRQTDGTWAQEAKLTASDGAPDDRFGISVSVSGDTALVGAFQDGDAGSLDLSGSAYVFRRHANGTWMPEAKLTASDARPGDRFGFSVSLSGDTAVVGMDSGFAYAFRRTNGSWTEETKFSAPDAGAGEAFGLAVSVSGDTAIVTAPFDDDVHTDSGSAYVFRRQTDGTWTQEAKLTASDAGPQDWLGFSVSLSGDAAVIGARLDDDGLVDSGSAYVFRRLTDGTWTEEAKLTASDAIAGDQFGVTVSVSGDTAVVGAFLDDHVGTNSGSAYMFRRTGGTWSQEAKFIASDAAAEDQFGVSVAVSGNTAVVGAHRDDDAGTNSGSVYFFELTDGGLAIDTTSMPDGTVGTSYSATLQASGGTGSLSWSIVAGALPDGLALNAATGEISGTPSTSGNFAFTVQVADSSSPAQSDTRDLSITVAGTPPLSINTTSLPDAAVDVFYRAALSATGGSGPFDWRLASGSGSLPDGLQLDPAGEISGIPTAPGTFDFTVEVTDSSSPPNSSTQPLSIVVAPSAAGGLAFSAQPTNTLVGDVITPAVEVTLTDSDGAPLPGITVSLSLLPHPAGGALAGTVAAITDGTGTASFSTLSVDAGGQAYVLEASTASGSATATSVAFDVFRLGGVFAWGWNNDGQLGDGTTEDRSTPTRVIELSDASAVVAGLEQTVALVSDGTLRAWGDNGLGQLGDGSTTSSSTPVQVSGLSDIVAVSGRHRNGLALKSDGTVWGWGSNDFGQLGDGTKIDRLTPVQVSGLTDGRAIAGGDRHSLALRPDATLWAWGSNGFGQLGIGNDTIESLTPTQVTGLVNVVTIGVGALHSLAVTADGAAWAWGRNAFGQLGDGTTTNQFAPVRVSGLSNVIAVAGGFEHSLALRLDGTVWGWGRNNFGQLGDGTQIDTSTPVQVQGLSGVVAIAAGNAHSLALKDDGTVVAWGSNAQGRLGDGTTANSSTPVQVSGLGRGLAISGGGAHSVAATSTLAITTTSLPDAEVDVAYNATLQAVGGIGDRTWSIVGGGSPAPGLTLNGSTGEISSTPTTAGTFDFTVQVADGAGQSDTQDLSITINTVGGAPLLTITTTALQNAVAGAPFMATLEASGGTSPLSWDITTGALPDGLSLSAATGEISGTPTSLAVGTANFTVRVSDGADPPQTDTQDLAITVVEPVLSFVSQPPSGVAGDFFSIQVRVEDDVNNTVEGVTVTLSLTGNGEAATISGVIARASDISGIVDFPNLSIDRGGDFAMVATANPAVTSEVFDVEGFFPTGRMADTRAFHAASRLADGRVLVTGGQGSGGAIDTSIFLRSAEFYDPGKDPENEGVFVPAGEMGVARAGHTSTLLGDGTVLVLGGARGGDGDSAEIFNPLDVTFGPLIPLPEPRLHHTATRLLGDRVLIAGGVGAGATARVFNPLDGTFSDAIPMQSARHFHTATLLTDGRVLITGGRTADDLSTTTATAEIFNPETESFVAVESMSVDRELHTATLLGDGTVLIAGGSSFDGVASVTLDTAEIFDPSADLFALLEAKMIARRGTGHRATLLPLPNFLPGSLVLLTGASGGSAEIFDPATKSFRSTGLPVSSREDHTATLLPDGDVLLVGGFDFSTPGEGPSGETRAVEIFHVRPSQ